MLCAGDTQVMDFVIELIKIKYVHSCMHWEST